MKSKAHRGRTVSEAEFRRLWSDLTLTTAEIGRLLDVSESAVCQRARTRGLPARGYNRVGQYLIGPDREAEFCAMWLGSVRSKLIAEHFQTYATVIADTAARLGLPPRGKSWQHRGVTVAEFRQQQLAAALAASAAETRAAMRDAEMVDGASHMWGRAA